MNANISRVWDDPTVESRRTGRARAEPHAKPQPGRITLALRLWFWRIGVQSGPVLKRIVDISGALFALTFLSPVFLGTWLAIRLEDGGPALYTQKRVGRNGRHFTLFKFRSMVLDADRIKSDLADANESAGGVLFKIRRDPRITRTGVIIRKFSIDELPQLFNVLRGDMSLVGPRPALPDEVARYRQADRVRLSVKPGITCLWQVGGRSEIDFAGQVRLDMRYIREHSLWNDIVILFRTVPAVLTARGAY